VWYVPRPEGESNPAYEEHEVGHKWKRMRVTEIDDTKFRVIPTRERMAKSNSSNVGLHVPQMGLHLATSNEHEKNGSVWVDYKSRSVNSSELLDIAHSNLRCIEWKNISLELMSDSSDMGGSNELSRPVKDGEAIDFFMSHSWHDDPVSKFNGLKELVAEFRLQNSGREPTFWLDKVCIDQENIKDGLKVLPINVMACKKMLVLCGKTYPARLWCAWELCTLFSFMREEQALERVELVATDSNVDVMEILTTFDVMNAHCYDPNEEAKLRRVIRAVGTDQFNKRIHALASACLEETDRRNRDTASQVTKKFIRRGSTIVTNTLSSLTPRGSTDSDHHSIFSFSFSRGESSAESSGGFLARGSSFVGGFTNRRRSSGGASGSPPTGHQRHSAAEDMMGASADIEAGEGDEPALPMTDDELNGLADLDLDVHVKTVKVTAASMDKAHAMSTTEETKMVERGAGRGGAPETAL
jgi:hypothetical protein